MIAHRIGTDMADLYSDPNSLSAPASTPKETVYADVEPPMEKADGLSSPAASADIPEWQQVITDWVRENQILAMAGGFALGVFMGVLLRD